ncbi:MAG: hypothetical protein M3279_01975 [Actinomycetota bacterium]|nr:hypothetical protein [Actinomycetota bacterium]
MNDREKDLQAEELADLARRLERALEVEAPDARREKALFVAGAGARARRSPWTAALVPATAAVALLVALAVVSRTALPGQTLYPVRKVLGGVGLAPSTAREVRSHVDEAEELVTAAAASAVSEPARAQDLAQEAMGVLAEAEELVNELDGERADAFDREIDTLEERAKAAYDEADDTLDEREEEAESREDRGDSGGRGSGGGDDDSSGPGSGDDDSSGSGSGGGNDDSSGPGSGRDDSSSSGSGGDDSSGPGSGDD